MTSAFSIDIEIAPSIEAANTHHIFCACLDARWEVERSTTAIQEFHKILSQDNSTKTVIPNSFNPDNLIDIEEYLCALGCAAPVLRSPKFYDFLDIPKVVRDGLQYVSDKPYGESIRAGPLQKRPSFARRGGGKRHCVLTKDDRGHSLLLYSNQNSKFIIGSFKIGATTTIQKLPEFENTFVLLADKRQWVLQATSQREFVVWSSQLGDAVSQIGGTNLLVKGGKQEQKTMEENNNNNNNNNNNKDNSGKKHTKGDQAAIALQQKNTQLSAEIKELENNCETVKVSIQTLRKETLDLQNTQENMRTAIRKHFDAENKDIIQTYELEHEALRKKN